MRKILFSGGVALAFTIAGCGEDAIGPQEVTDVGGMEAASAPVIIPFEVVFDDLNPCSGAIHTVTIRGTERVHQHNHNTVAHGERTITTSSGFVGRGTHTVVVTGKMFKLTLNDMLRHPSGARIRAHAVLIFNLPSGEVRLEKGAVSCVRR
jgi:hypothetical protein